MTALPRQDPQPRHPQPNTNSWHNFGFTKIHVSNDEPPFTSQRDHHRQTPHPRSNATDGAGAHPADLTSCASQTLATLGAPTTISSMFAGERAWWIASMHAPSTAASAPAFDCVICRCSVASGIERV